MKTINLSYLNTRIYHLFFIGISVLFIACNNNPSKEKTKTSEVKETKIPNIVWQLKAIHPDGTKLDIKAIDKEGNLFDVNAIQDSDQDSFLDIKAFVGDKELPVKMLISDKNLVPVKAIDIGGVSYDIKAITSEGEKLDVKGIHRQGNVVSLKAIDKDGKLYKVKAISPEGKLDDVKGIKINVKDKEMTYKGFSIFAHIKAMHESDDNHGEEDLIQPKKKSKSKNKKGEEKVEFKPILWKVNAITSEGKNLTIKAIDTAGVQYDIKAVQDSKQQSFMNIKAMINGKELPVKVLVSDDEYAPVKALERDGTNYAIKAITEDGKLLDVKGISRSGNIINLKAVNKDGSLYDIKAISPDGKLNDIKGIKIFKRNKEMTISGNMVYAHVKAITH